MNLTCAAPHQWSLITFLWLEKRNYVKPRNTYYFKWKIMRDYVEDESDPGLISKKFWKWLKSTSEGTKIPETVLNYGTKFRNNPVSQSELVNEFFCDQFSDASSHDIDIDYTYDKNFHIDFNFRRVRRFPKLVNPNKVTGPD